MRDGETAVEAGSASREETLERVDPLLVLPKKSVGIEIGVERAIHARLILEVVDPVHLTLCDIWRDPAIAESAFERMKPYWGRITIRRKASVELAKEFSDESLDWAYIDACHSYESIRADIAAWFPKIKLDGWLLCHDMWIPDAECAVRDSVKQISHLHLVGIGADRLHTAILRKVQCAPEVK